MHNSVFKDYFTGLMWHETRRMLWGFSFNLEKAIEQVELGYLRDVSNRKRSSYIYMCIKSSTPELVQQSPRSPYFCTIWAIHSFQEKIKQKPSESTFTYANDIEMQVHKWEV